MSHLETFEAYFILQTFILKNGKRGKNEEREKRQDEYDEDGGERVKRRNV